jgi:alpha-D-ribose 1-methylphosphonate 5-phosphate C-P lyase
MIGTSHQILIRMIKSRRISRAKKIPYVGRKMPTRFWWGNMKGRDHLENLRKDGKILKLISQNKDKGRKPIKIKQFSIATAVQHCMYITSLRKEHKSCN